MDTAKRGVGAIRLSSMTEDTTSPVRQREVIQGHANSHGIKIIGWAEDLDVSAGITPADRPELGQWLKRPDEYDLLIFAKLDRAVRSLRDFVNLMQWCEDHSTTLVILDPPLDLTTIWGKAMAGVLAVFAELERGMIKQRTKEGYDEIIETGRWPGGRPPYGYKPVRRPGQDGWYLVIDESRAGPLRTAIDAVMAGKSIRSQAIALQKSGIPTPTGGERWNPLSLAKIMRSRNLLGQWDTTDGVIRDKTGLPIQRADPIINRTAWDRLQEVLNASVYRKKGNRSDGSNLLQIAFCGQCNRPMYRAEKRKKLKSGEMKHYAYYRCASHNSAHTAPCPDSSFRADELEEIIFSQFLAIVGGLDVQERVYIPGDDHTEALELALTSYRELTERHATLKPGIAKQTLSERLSALEEIIGDLESKPSRPPGWRYEETGQTYRELWEAMTGPERGALLRQTGVSAYVGRLPNGQPAVSLVLPEDLQERVQNTRS